VPQGYGAGARPSECEAAAPPARIYAEKHQYASGCPQSLDPPDELARSYTPTANSTPRLSGAGDVDDEAEAESGEGGFDLFHARGVTEVEHAIDLRQMPAQPACEFGAADALLTHCFVKRGLCHSQRRKRHHRLVRPRFR
jgi:hypothetical protein